MSTTLTLVPDQDGTAAQPPQGILEELLAAARTLFNAGPVIELESDVTPDVPIRLTATMLEVAKRVVIDRYGDNQDGDDVFELLSELWRWNVTHDLPLLQKMGDSFPLFITNTARHSLSGLAFVQAIAWVASRLEWDPDIARENALRASQ